MQRISVSPYAINVLDLVGADLVDSNREPVAVSQLMNGTFQIERQQDGHKVTTNLRDNVSASRYLNMLEVRYRDKFISVGDRVAWQMADGNTNVGEVTMRGLGTKFYVKAPNGEVIVEGSKLRHATHEDVEACNKFFKLIGS